MKEVLGTGVLHLWVKKTSPERAPDSFQRYLMALSLRGFVEEKRQKDEIRLRGLHQQRVRAQGCY